MQADHSSKINDPNRRQPDIVVHESLPVGVALAMAGGFLDAYTYLFHGEVFASMQSGNVILLGINLASGEFGQAARYLPPILLFLIGIIVTNGLQHRFPTGGRIVWQNVALFFEALGIFLLGFLLRHCQMSLWILTFFFCSHPICFLSQISWNALCNDDDDRKFAFNGGLSLSAFLQKRCYCRL